MKSENRIHVARRVEKYLKDNEISRNEFCNELGVKMDRQHFAEKMNHPEKRGFTEDEISAMAARMNVPEEILPMADKFDGVLKNMESLKDGAENLCRDCPYSENADCDCENCEELRQSVLALRMRGIKVKTSKNEDGETLVRISLN